MLSQRNNKKKEACTADGLVPWERLGPHCCEEGVEGGTAWSVRNGCWIPCEGSLEGDSQGLIRGISADKSAKGGRVLTELGSQPRWSRLPAPPLSAPHHSQLSLLAEPSVSTAGEIFEGRSLSLTGSPGPRVRKELVKCVGCFSFDLCRSVLTLEVSDCPSYASAPLQRLTAPAAPAQRTYCREEVTCSSKSAVRIYQPLSFSS